MFYLRRWLPAALWAIVIFVGSSTPGAVVSSDTLVNFLAHKAVHVLEYAFFQILLFRATSNHQKAFLLLLMFAIFDEIHQAFVPGRLAKLTDVIIDIGSGGATALALWKLLPILPNKLKNWLTSWLTA